MSMGGAKPWNPRASSASAGLANTLDAVCSATHERSAASASSSASRATGAGGGPAPRTLRRSSSYAGRATVVPSVRRRTTPESHADVTPPNHVYTYTREIARSFAARRSSASARKPISRNSLLVDSRTS